MGSVHHKQNALKHESLLDVFVMKCQKSPEQYPRIMVSLVYRGRGTVEPEQGINRSLGGADRIFNRENDVVGKFAKLPDEGEVF